jgi:hypothetical protein
MDAVEPELLATAERSVAATPGVEHLNELPTAGHASHEIAAHHR